MVGFLWGALTGELVTSLKISLFFELLWLDAIPVGTYIPPLMAASTLASLTLDHLYGLTDPGRAAIPMLLCLPMAILGTRVDGILREWNRRSYNRLLFWVRDRDPKVDTPTRVVQRTLLASLCTYWLFFILCLLVLVPVTGLFLRHFGLDMQELGIKWHHLWLAATLGGLLSIRLRRAYGVLFAGCACIMIFYLTAA